MYLETAKRLVRAITKQEHVEITTRGNAAIQTALSLAPKGKKILIPEEGGWLSYRTTPAMLGLEYEEVHCHDAKVNVHELEIKLKTGLFGALLYQNPGGYFATQPMSRIYTLCKKYNCLVILDVSGSIGTHLCDGEAADILVGSFGKGKLVNAGNGGFISFKNRQLWEEAKNNQIELLRDNTGLNAISKSLDQLSQRIAFLVAERTKIIEDLKSFPVVYPEDKGFVIVVKYQNEQEKEKIINYCSKNKLEWTECPRYIRLNKPAISIELKRL